MSEENDGYTEAERSPGRGRVQGIPAQLSLIAALSALVGALYFLFAPVFLDTGTGWFACGSVIGGYPSDFAERSCSGAPSLNRARAFALFGLAAVFALGAHLMNTAPRGHAARVDDYQGGDDAPRRPRRARELDEDIDLGRSEPPAERRARRRPTRDSWDD